MSETPPPGGPSSPEHQPNWGSAYPPPQHGAGQGATPPPGYYYPYPVPPKHTDATTSMVMGIVAVAGLFVCGIPVLMAPFAWYLGAKAEREIDASAGALSGRSEATAGKVLGIVGTALLALAVAGIVLLVVLTYTQPDFWDDDSSYDSVLGALLSSVQPTSTGSLTSVMP
ncbi:DUF4190 domain-containing protein [Aeromicrobium endophyticum]|uniref:DUF4190 domain-containing protein n=1 Tax=Aeromicrobium endophyticum TaxID=2292704 RepID=A0A371P915_9ACTN|nr:DUF4190 domain-containing protein [Aeromicrobium endophyticum]REK72431.1 DUF4190 domain-containing protein [Aeromicrobium endophyticum]